ncbi:MAG: penicillin-binding transpeptidase domain-containing protein [Candidatus Hydrothermales bacterium]
MEKDFSIKVLNSFLIFSFFLFFLKLFDYQVLKGEFFEKKAIEIKSKKIRLPSKRGKILDRNGIIVSYWRTGFRLLKGDSLYKEDVQMEEVIRYLEDPDSSKLFNVYALLYRYYPFENIFAQTIGYTGLPDKKDVERGIDPLLRIGKVGLEKFYDDILRGSDGYKFLLMDVKGRVYNRETRPPLEPIDGRDITVNLDMELGRFIDSLFKPFNKGACVVMNPKSGEVLALYSKPAYNLNYLTGKTEKEELSKVVNDSLHPLLNRCIQGLYPPGSIFKVITALIALEENLIDTNKTINCDGVYRFGNRVFKDWKKEGHGFVNFFKAIEVSCDVYFYEISRRIGLKRFLSYLEKLKIFEKTGIDLFEEKNGFRPDFNFYIKKYGKYGFGEGNVLNLGIGQGEILMTPLQIAFLFSLIACDGKAPSPFLLKDLKVEEVELPFKKENIRILKKALLKVVHGEEGTGRLSYVPGLKIVGKTGTAQNPFGKDHAQFACFFPFDDPKFTVYVIVENIGMGGEIAAPIAGKVVNWLNEKYLKSLQ